MNRKSLDIPVGSTPHPTDAAGFGNGKAGPLRPPLEAPATKASSGRSLAMGKEPEPIASIVSGVFSPACYRMLYRALMGSPFASDFDLGFMLADPAVATKAAKFSASLLKPNGKPGRPRSQEVTEALRMKSEGKSYAEIYAALGKKTKEERLALRDAMRKRRNRAKRADEPQNQ